MEIASEIEASARRLEGDGAQFFLVSTGVNKTALDLSPLGVNLQWIDVLESPQHEWSVPRFLTLYNLIDGLAFGGRGLAMPHWVMVDLAVLPSAIVIAAWPKERLLAEVQNGKYSAEALEQLNEILSDAEALEYKGPIPIAAYCAAPSIQPNRLVGWSLWSFVVGHGFATVVKGLALKAYKATMLDGVTQFDNISLRIHTRFGSLRLRSARLHIHTAPNSLVYESDLVADLYRNAEPSFLMDAHDTERQLLMQKAIDEGTSDFYIVAPGLIVENGAQRVPILEVPKSKVRN